VGSEFPRAVVVQVLLHLVSHVTLATVVLVVFGGRLSGVLGGSIVLLFALAPEIGDWTIFIMSETLAYSMTALLLACMMMLFRHLDKEHPAGMALTLWSATLLVSATLLGGTRDNWPYFLPILAMGLLLPLLFRSPSASREMFRVGLRCVLAVALLVVFLTQLASARRGERWRIGLTNVILQRVLTDEAIRDEWARAYGLPIDDELMQMAGLVEHQRGGQIHRHEPFQRWFDERGLRSYARYIVAHPIRVSREIHASQRETINDLALCGGMPGERTVLSRLAEHGLFFPLGGFPFWYLGLPIVLGLSLMLVAPAALRVAAYTLLLLAIYLPFQAALGYLADSSEVARHSAPVAAYVRLVWPLLILLLFETLARRTRASREGSDFRRRAVER
jgi:hypothetical protein